MLFDSWTEIGRLLLVGSLAYVGLVAMLRISGNRTLSKMNAFDFIVTVALGSILATILLSRDVALIEGLAAFALLIFLQFAVTWLSVRSPRFHRLVTSEPRLLLHNGEFLRGQMTAARVTEGEIRAALRESGVSETKAATAVVLETDGSISVIVGPEVDRPGSSLSDVPHPPG